jgi:hypothetical protein
VDPGSRSGILRFEGIPFLPPSAGGTPQQGGTTPLHLGHPTSRKCGVGC